jgi:hypothetical protein
MILGCNEGTNSNTQGKRVFAQKEVKREIVFDSFMNPKAYRWYHNDSLVFIREIDEMYPTAFSYEFYPDNIDKSLLKIPKINISKDRDSNNMMMLTYETHPLLFMGISFKPAHVKHENYYDRNQEVFWFDSKVSSVTITFSFKDQNKNIVKEISDIKVDFPIR